MLKARARRAREARLSAGGPERGEGGQCRGVTSSPRDADLDDARRRGGDPGEGVPAEIDDATGHVRPSIGHAAGGGGAAGLVGHGDDGAEGKRAMGARARGRVVPGRAAGLAVAGRRSGVGGGGRRGRRRRGWRGGRGRGTGLRRGLDRRRGRGRWRRRWRWRWRWRRATSVGGRGHLRGLGEPGVGQGRGPGRAGRGGGSHRGIEVHHHRGTHGRDAHEGSGRARKRRPSRHAGCAGAAIGHEGRMRRSVRARQDIRHRK